MRFFRFVGWLILLAALAIGVADGTRWWNSGGQMFRSALDWWSSVSTDSVAFVQGLVQQNFGSDMWDPAALYVLSWPAAAVLLLLSFAVFLLIGFLRSFGLR